MIRLLWALVMFTIVTAVGWSWTRYAGARRDADAQRNRADALVAQLDALQAAQRVTGAWTARQRPEAVAGGLASIVGETLAACGLPPTALVNVTPQAETPVAGGLNGASGLVRQRASLTLAPVTLNQFGAFLDAWRARQPHWTVATIDVGPEGRADASGAGGDLPLRAVLTLDTVFLDDTKSADTGARP